MVKMNWAGMLTSLPRRLAGPLGAAGSPRARHEPRSAGPLSRSA